MNRQKLLQQMVGVTLVALTLTGCGAPAATPAPSTSTPVPPTPQPGAWTTSPEAFGQIGFVVNDDSSAIIETKWTPALGWSCGEIGAAEIQGYHFASVPHPITEGSFVTELELWVGESLFESIPEGKLIITGSFTGVRKASGTWEFDFPNRGENCTGTWSAEP